VAEGERSKRLDAFLVSHERRVSRSSLQRLILAGRIRVNADVVKPSQKIKPGDRITIDKPEPGPLIVDNKPVSLEFLFEDEALLVVNKPAGVVVHPTSGNWKGTLLNGLLEHFQSSGKTNGLNNANVGPGMVHRLDKETSGLMVVAKTDQAHRVLCSQFEKHTITRTYEALVYGTPTEDKGTIDIAIGRDVIDGKKVSTKTTKPQTAITEFKVLQKFGDVASHVELTPHTGRQHQLRVHVATLGCPILGDQTYGGQQVCRIGEIDIPRMSLHARSLGFQHPISEKWEEFFIGMPAEMEVVLEKLKLQASFSMSLKKCIE
jgi:23S rRNA pseudouridine1911/1915/1917 synthase